MNVCHFHKKTCYQAQAYHEKVVSNLLLLDLLTPRRFVLSGIAIETPKSPYTDYWLIPEQFLNAKGK